MKMKGCEVMKKVMNLVAVHLLIMIQITVTIPQIKIILLLTTLQIAKTLIT